MLLLDEPLGALDLKLRKRLQMELKRIQTEVGITFVYVTHDQEEALTMSDRIAVMNRGKVEQLGTPEELYDRPTTRFVADFIGTTNLLHGPSRRSVRMAPRSGSTRATAPDRPVGREAGQAVDISLRPEAVAIGAGRRLRPDIDAAWTRSPISGMLSSTCPPPWRTRDDPVRQDRAAAPRRQGGRALLVARRGTRPRRSAGEHGGVT